MAVDVIGVGVLGGGAVVGDREGVAFASVGGVVGASTLTWHALKRILRQKRPINQNDLSWICLKFHPFNSTPSNIRQGGDVLSPAPSLWPLG